MPAIHLFRGLPLVLVPIGFHRNVLLGVLLSSIRITWPSQVILLLFINLTISTRTYNVPFLSCQIRNSDNSIEYAQHFCKRSNCKVDPVHTVKAYRGSTSKHPLILNHCSKRMWLVNITPLPLPARKSPGKKLNTKLGEPHGRSEKNYRRKSLAATGIRTPNRQNRRRNSGICTSTNVESRRK